MRSLTLSALLLLTGCLFQNVAPEERLRDAVLELNDGLRWGRVELAAGRVDDPYRTAFLAAHQSWGHGVRIADTEVVAVKLADDRNSAEVHVDFRWYATSTATLRSTTLEQEWEHRPGGVGFVLVSERVAAGDPVLLASAAAVAK